MVILTGANGVEIRTLQCKKVDIDINSTMDFEIQMSVEKYEEDIVPKCRVFVPGTEFGGMVDGRKVNTAEGTVTMTGKTWRAFLEKKILIPPAGSAYKTVSGELNAIIRSLITEKGLGELMTGSTEDTGVSVSNFKFDRYTTLRKGLTKLLESVGYRMKLTYIQGEQGAAGYVLIEAVEIEDYSETTEVSQDSKVDFSISETTGQINHLVCLGQGELEERTVIHLYVQQDGTIGHVRYYTGVEEFEAVFDYSSAEDDSELEKYGIERLQELMDSKHFEMNVEKLGIDVGIGDIIGGRDHITKMQAAKPVINKIYKEEGETKAIEYIVEGEMAEDEAIQ